jgi:aminoglycoside 6'-N-acetyltransferase
VRERLERADVEAHVVEADGGRVGYLQVWHEGDETGLDMFLAPDARGRGLGPDAARAVAQALLADGAPEVTVDPYLWNEAAIRAWGRAGFEPVEEREPDEDHASRWLLMRFNPRRT